MRHRSVAREQRPKVDGASRCCPATGQDTCIQPKLTIGAPDDVHEREAERVADEVMRRPAPTGGVTLATPPIQANEPLQRLCSKCKEKLQRRPEGEGAASPTGEQPASADVVSRVQSLRGGGQPLPPDTRAFFESHLGHDFGQVRVHSDTRAAETAGALRARAFTSRTDIAFAPGQYAPGTAEGRHLLAHELTHVLQQTGGSPRPRGDVHGVIQRQPAGVQPFEKDGPEPDTLRRLLDVHMPVGRGYHLEADIGVTPVVPFFVSEGRLIEVKRLDDKHIHILYRQQGIGAWDSGVGGGAYIGTKKHGLGASMGAHAQAGLKVVTHQEFVVPIERIGGFLWDALTDRFLPTPQTVGSPGSSLTVLNALQMGLQRLGGSFLEGYEVRRLINSVLFAQGSAEVVAGLREHNPSREGKERLSRGNYVLDVAPMTSAGNRVNPAKLADNEWSVTGLLQQLSNLRAAIQGRVEAGINLDQKRTMRPDGSAEHEITYEYEGAAGVDLQLPIFKLLPIPPGVGGGLSVKTKLSTDASGKVTSKATEWTLYVKSGELDVYAGSASKETFKLNAFSVESITELIELLTPGGEVSSLGSLARAMLQKVEVQQRYNLALEVGTKFKTFMRNRTGTRTLMADASSWSKATKGASIGAYLTVNYGMDEPELLEVWKLIKPAAATAYARAQDTEGLFAAYQALKQFTQEFMDSPQYAQLETLFLDSVYVTEATIRFTAEAGIGAQVQIAELAKARLDGFVELGLFCEHNFASNRITLRNFLSVASEILADPREYIPDCPLLRWMYDNLSGENEPRSGSDSLPDERGQKGASRQGEGSRVLADDAVPGRVTGQGSRQGGAVVEVQPVERNVKLSGKRKRYSYGGFRYVSGQGFEGQIIHELDGITYTVWVPLRLVEDLGNELKVALDTTLPLRITPQDAPPVYLYPNSPPNIISKSRFKNIKAYKKPAR